MELAEIKAIIERQGIHTVELGFADINGVLRGKRVSARHFLKTAYQGTALARGPLAWDIQCGVYPDTEIANFENGYPDMLARPVLSTFRIVAWRDGCAFVLCDLYDVHGQALEESPREVLKKVVVRAQALGYRPLVGSELEFYLLDGNKQPLFQGVQCYSLYKGAQLEYVIEEMRNGLENFGIEVEAFHLEYGPAQIEVILEYGDALTLADHTVLAKNAIKEIARKHGLYATFMAKPWAEESGCGYHIHQSLWDPDLTGNLFHINEELARHYLAGLLYHTRDFMVLGSPSVNSFKRFQGNSFAPVNVTWATDNRTAAVRSLLGQGNGSRLEHRTGSADANPYLIVAANLAAGLYGIEHKLVPPPITATNACLADAQVLPADLQQALHYLAKNQVAKDYLGEKFIQLFLTLGRHEAALYAAAVTDWERERYLEMI
ncbi:glutamine synthetase family protein [Sporomusa sp.]|uniref:glutamine synthetase family protein n=1 Tax=Sporomusa sp. TaxID=2078658 RepID=UPI002C6DFC6E|nr:glutamine synthetase family protein [Sporomusa sp.]HWR09334.1 glutamine synthetase family protein [Sporomusa sp.]